MVLVVLGVALVLGVVLVVLGVVLVVLGMVLVALVVYSSTCPGGDPGGSFYIIYLGRRQEEPGVGQEETRSQEEARRTPGAGRGGGIGGQGRFRVETRDSTRRRRVKTARRCVFLP